MLAFLKRMWIPIVVVVAIGLGGVAVVRLRGVFGSDKLFSSTASSAEAIVSFNPKRVTYEVFGPGDTTGHISFLNMNAAAEEADFTSLPWTSTLTTTVPAVIANIVAQGDSDTIGCRIFVNGVLRDEQSSTGRHAQTFCLVKAA